MKQNKAAMGRCGKARMLFRVPAAKKVFSMVLAGTMLVSMMPTTAFAKGDISAVAKVVVERFIQYIKEKTDTED